MRREYAISGGSNITFYDYIYADGNCCIDTGLTCSTGTTSIETEYGIIPIKEAGSSELLCVSYGTAGVQIYTSVYSGSYRMYNQGMYLVITSGTYYEFETYTSATERKIRRKGGSWSTQSFSRTITDGSKIYIFDNTLGTTGMKNDKLYYMNIKRNGTYVRKYKPAIVNGVAGLYDEISGELHTSATGILTLGND